MNENAIFSFESIPLIKELLELNHEVSLIVYGANMRPFFYHQKTVVTLTNPTEIFKRFDVVLYYHLGEYKLSRVLKVHGDQLIVCGDASVQLEYIYAICVFGIVTSYKNGNRKISTHNRKYLKQVRLWSFFRPFRPFIIRLYKPD